MLNRKLFGVPLSVILAVVGIAAVILILLNLGSIWSGVLGAGEDVLEFTFRPDERVDEVILCADSPGCQIVHPIVYSLVVLLVLLTGFAYTTLLERKLVSYFQQRIGPNRAGPWGLLQPVADGVKLIFKENIRPEGANHMVYRLAPILKVLPTMIVIAVIPFGPDMIIPWFDGNWYQVPLGLVDINVGILWILGITSLGTYGVALAGWSSNNKYSMLGGLRASAQMISYELSMGLALAVPVLIAGSMSIRDIVEAQQSTVPFAGWFIFQNPLAGVILMVALVAETNRAPFDLPEAEQELTAGYMTEYSGMKFALFMMAEYLGMIAVSLIAASTFFGGYDDGFGLVNSIPILGPVVLIGKVILFLMGFIWLRATLPRIRYDRLMTFGWKIMLPLAIAAVVWQAVAIVIGEELGGTAYVIFAAVTFGVITLVAAYFFLRDQGQDAADDDTEDDPMITGQRSGIVYAGLMLIGGLIAIPISLFNATIRVLDSVAALGQTAADDDSTDGDDGEQREAGEEQAALPSGGD